MTNRAPIVADIKNELEIRGVNLAGPCGAFEITRRVAWMLRNDGWGFLVAPPGGENCNGFRTDKLVTQDARFVDLLVDAGGANTPTWQERAATPAEIAAWRAPLPVDEPPAPVPSPDPTPAPAPPPDVVAFAHELFHELEAIHGGLSDLTAAVLQLKPALEAIVAKGVKIHL